MKLFWLTLTFGFICFASKAQQTNNSTAQQPSGSEKLFFPDFSFTVKDINRVQLQWTVDSTVRNDYFIVEHGKDTAHFETLGILKKSNDELQYEMIDNNAFNGFNYYRLKFTDSSGTTFYSRILQASSNKADFKFYPNPADKLLIVETEHFSDLQILNAMGTILISKQLLSGVQIINVSSLEKGDYILRASDRSTNKVILEHLLKN